MYIDTWFHNTNDKTPCIYEAHKKPVWERDRDRPSASYFVDLNGVCARCKLAMCFSTLFFQVFTSNMTRERKKYTPIHRARGEMMLDWKAHLVIIANGFFSAKNIMQNCLTSIICTGANVYLYAFLIFFSRVFFLLGRSAFTIPTPLRLKDSAVKIDLSWLVEMCVFFSLALHSFSLVGYYVCYNIARWMQCMYHFVLMAMRRWGALGRTHKLTDSIEFSRTM